MQCWGTNATDQVPSGTYTDLDVAYYYACAVNQQSEVVWRGSLDHGQGDAPELGFSSVSGLHRHSCGLTLENRIECWGDNMYGQCEVPN